MSIVLSSKLVQTVPGLLRHWCPGCQALHPIHVAEANGQRPSTSVWSWNKDAERPTFSPSIRVLGEGNTTRCHYFIREGKIEFCRDSNHHLAGKTVELPDIPQDIDHY